MIYICVITDIVPSVSLIFETPEADLLKQAPRNPRKDHLVTWQLLTRAYGFMGMLESFAAFFMYFWYMASYGGMYPGDLVLLYDGYTEGFKGKTQQELDDLLSTAQTAFFLTLVICQFGNLLVSIYSNDHSIVRILILYCREFVPLRDLSSNIIRSRTKSREIFIC
jgi:sodium/potassium-transporting ATPase subunit alpha